MRKATKLFITSVGNLSILLSSFKFFLSLYPTSSLFEVGYILVSTCPSVRLCTQSCPFCIFHNTSWIYFIFTPPINQLKKKCHALSFFLNSKILIFARTFLAATKQLYEWSFPSFRLSVCTSVSHTFFTMFLSSYHHEIFRSYYHGQK